MARRTTFLLLAACLVVALSACSMPPEYDPRGPGPIGGRFINVEPHPLPEPSTSQWLGFYGMWLDRYSSTPRQMPAWQLPRDAVRVQLKEAERREGHVWLGHAAVLVNLGGKRVLFDPFLSEYYGPVRLPGLRRKSPVPAQVADLPSIDAVVISHDHYDHLDRTTILELLARQPELTVVVPKGLGELVSGWGAKDVRELTWHQSTALGGVKVIAVPAVHHSGRGLGDKNKSLWAGWLLREGSRQVYFSGDTSDGKFFAGIEQRYGPTDLAFIAVGAYGPDHLLSRFHLTPEQGWAGGQALNAARVVPIHWGVMTNSAEPLEEPLQRFAAAAGIKTSDVPPIGQFVSWSSGSEAQSMPPTTYADKQ